MLSAPLSRLIAIAVFLSRVTALPQDQQQQSSSSSSSAYSSSSSKSWPKGKQVGVIVGVIIGAAIVLFLWGWVLKGRKMFHGQKVLWVKSKLAFSPESRQAAHEERLENKRRHKEEIEKFWGQPVRHAPPPQSQPQPQQPAQPAQEAQPQTPQQGK